MHVCTSKKKNFLIESGTGAHPQVVPLAFLMPSRDPFSPMRLLGFGDVVLPSLLLSAVAQLLATLAAPAMRLEKTFLSRENESCQA